MQKKVLKRKDFIKLNKETFYSGHYVHINYRTSPFPFFRFGITVTKKWGNAVARNQFKRRVRHALCNQKPLPEFTDLQVRPKRGKKPIFNEIQADLESFFNKKLTQ